MNSHQMNVLEFCKQAMNGGKTLTDTMKENPAPSAGKTFMEPREGDATRETRANDTAKASTTPA